MNIYTFKGVEKYVLPELETQIQEQVETQISDSIEDEKQKSNRLKPLVWFLFFFLLTCGGIGWSWYITNSTYEPETVTVPTDDEILEVLTQKIVDRVPLTALEWDELCRILADIYNIETDVCSSCQDFISALLGGKHGGWLDGYLDLPDAQISRGIRSLEKQIAEHLDKIANPQNYYPEWNTLDSRHQNDLINNKWNKDIQRQREQKKILECLLKSR